MSDHASDFVLQAINFDTLEGWKDDDPSGLFEVMRSCRRQITVRIASQLISATYDKADVLIEGDAENVAEVNDVWTFARDTRSRDPNWKLVATESEHE